MQDVFVGGYSLLELFWYFVLFSFLGWLLEVAYHYAYEMSFVNRGFLFGPICPIYGVGMVLILITSSLLGLQEMPFSFFSVLINFVTIALLTTLVELLVGIFLMLVFRQRWWDYSEERFNFRGYVSLRFSIYWGLGGSFVYYLFYSLELLNGLKLPLPQAQFLAYGVALYIILDLAKSIDLAFQLRRFATEVALASRELKQRIEAVTEVELDALRIEALIRKDRLDLVFDEFSERFKMMKASNRRMLNRAINRYDRLIHGEGVQQFKHLLRAFPKMRDLRYAQSLEALKEAIKRFR